MKLFALAFLVLYAKAADIRVNVGSSINAALEEANPGDTVILEDGVHKQDIKSVRDGQPDKYIVITGSRKAIVNGNKDSRMIQINHSYIQLEGFTVDGKQGSGDKVEDYVDKGVYVLGTKKPEVIRDDKGEYESSIDGFKLTNAHVQNLGGECVRLRSFITNAEVMGNVIENCGVHDFQFPSSTVNGEAIYVGTSSNQWMDGKNSRAGPDLTKYIHIHHNEITPRANECVDVKEGTTMTLVEYNVCSEQLDEHSAGLDSRTDEVIFRYNEVFNTAGAGVRIGGHNIDGKTYGMKNEVYGNVFFNTAYSSIKTLTGSDHILCENTCKDGCSIAGTTSKSYTSMDSNCPSESKMINPSWTTPGEVLDLIDKVRDEENEKTEEEENAKDSNDSPEFSILTEEKTVVHAPKCSPLKIKGIKASDSDGNKPGNAIDGKAASRWSSKKIGAWIELELEYPSIVDSVEMAFYKGDSRLQNFDVYGDGEPLLKNMKSSGKTLGLEQFPIETKKDVTKVTIFGNGNSENSWSSLTEITVCGKGDTDQQEHDSPASGNLCETKPLAISSVSASGNDGNVPQNVLVDDSTRWSCKGSPCELTFSLTKDEDVMEISFIVYNGKGRVQSFDVDVEIESGWITVIQDELSVKNNGLQSFDIDVSGVKTVKFIGYGCDTTDWNSISFVQLIGCK